MLEAAIKLVNGAKYSTVPLKVTQDLLILTTPQRKRQVYGIQVKIKTMLNSFIALLSVKLNLIANLLKIANHLKDLSVLISL